MLPLLNPEEIPPSPAELGTALPADVRLALTMACRLLEASEDRDAAEIVGAALQTLPGGGAPTVGLHQSHRQEGQGYAEYDAYFAVVRVGDEPARALLRGALVAYAEVLHDKSEGGSALTPEEWNTLRIAFSALFAFMRAPDAGPPQDRCAHAARRTPRARREARPVHPLERWRIGHHVFFVLIQGLIMAFRCFEHAMAARDLQQAGAALDLATALMHGSATALRVASDFPPDDYERVVRPSMSPPHVSSGFSGLLSVDHKVMLTVIRRLRPLLAEMPTGLEEKHSRYLVAASAAYDAHKYVCERFKGDAQPSLRQPTGADRPAVDVLEQLKRNRLRTMAPEPTHKRRTGRNVA
jgi:hypothetical protein